MCAFLPEKWNLWESLFFADEAHRATWGREIIYIYIYPPPPNYLFFLRERNAKEGMWLCGLQTLMEACGLCSERVGRPMMAPGAEGTRGQDRRQQQEATPTSICALCSAPTLPASCFLETRSVCAQNLLSCWLVCEFYQDLTHVYFSLSTEIRAFIQEKSDSKRAVPAPLPEPALSLVCLGSVDFSQSFQHVSVSQEPVFAEILFFTHSKEMWNTPTFFHTIWEDQIFFSNLWRYW